LQQFELGVVTLNECKWGFFTNHRTAISLMLLDPGNADSSQRAYAPLTIIAFRPIDEPTEGRNIGDLSPISG
jgi:hypothetical protein